MLTIVFSTTGPRRLLHKLVVVDAELLRALHTLRQMFMLARGDLWQQFIDE